MADFCMRPKMQSAVLGSLVTPTSVASRAEPRSEAVLHWIGLPAELCQHSLAQQAQAQLITAAAAARTIQKCSLPLDGGEQLPHDGIVHHAQHRGTVGCQADADTHEWEAMNKVRSACKPASQLSCFHQTHHG